MKDLNEFYTFLKDKKDPEIVALIDKDMKELINKFGVGADLPFKSQIRLLDNFKNLTEWYFRDKLPNLIKREGDKQNKEKSMTVQV